MATPVSRWFGNTFNDLHPLLQDLHLHGGQLTGDVHLEYAPGLVGFFAKRVAAKMGLPKQAGTYPFTLCISHNNNHLLWSRTFNPAHTMESVFTPHGGYPDGFWCEKTGFTELLLAVQIILETSVEPVARAPNALKINAFFQKFGESSGRPHGESNF